MRTYKDRGHFMLSGDFDPAFISARLGLEPDFTRIKGELDPETGHPYIVSLWCLKCSDEAVGGVVDQITFLLRRLGPHSDNVASLCARFAGQMEPVAPLGGYDSGFNLSSGMVIQLASLNLGMAFNYVHTGLNKEREAMECQ